MQQVSTLQITDFLQREKKVQITLDKWSFKNDKILAW